MKNKLILDCSKFLTASFFLASLGSLVAKAECKDLVMRMASPTSKREITTFFNCHGASYSIPEATTTHFFEWKSDKLCQTTRVCGNVSAWRANFGVGAVWTFGTSVSDFANKVSYLNNSEGSAQPNYLNYIVANNGNLCLNSASNKVATYQKAGGGNQTLNCYPKAMLNQQNWSGAIGELEHAGYRSTTGKSWNDSDIDFVCAQGDQNNILTSKNGVIDQANIQNCNSANINLHQNGSSEGYSPVWKKDSGYQNSDGSVDTDYSQVQLNVFANMNFENIERYCKAPEPEYCY
jgi:hypothetical protein